MTTKIKAPNLVADDLKLTEEFLSNSKEDLIFLRESLKSEKDVAKQQVAELSERLQKIKDVQASLSRVDELGYSVYTVADPNIFSIDDLDSISIKDKLAETAGLLCSQKERIELIDNELNALNRVYLKKEVEEYRQKAETSFKRFLEVTDVNRLDSEGTFIFVTKKQLMSFWNRLTNYDGENYAVYGLVDVCDLTEDDFLTASVVSDGVNFYRGIKNNYSPETLDYWSVDYSEVSYGRFLKPINAFAVNLKYLLEGAGAIKHPRISDSRLEMLKNLIDSLPSAVSAIPFEIISVVECRRVIESALNGVIDRFYNIVERTKAVALKTLVDNYKKTLFDKYNERLEMKKFCKR